MGVEARRRQWHLTCDTPLPPLIFWQPQNYPTMFSPTIFLQPDILMLEFLCFIPEIKICYLSLCSSSSWVHDYLFNKIASLFLQLELMCVQLSKCPLFRLGKGAENQNGNLRWHLPWREGGLEGVSSATYLFWKMIFVKNHLESFPDCENVFCT